MAWKHVNSTEPRKRPIANLIRGAVGALGRVTNVQVDDARGLARGDMPNEAARGIEVAIPEHLRAVDVLRDRAAAALDRTHEIGDRGPTTFLHRARVAAFLDGKRVPKRDLLQAISWLEDVPQVAPPALPPVGNVNAEERAARERMLARARGGDFLVEVTAEAEPDPPVLASMLRAENAQEDAPDLWAALDRLALAGAGSEEIIGGGAAPAVRLVRLPDLVRCSACGSEHRPGGPACDLDGTEDLNASTVRR